MSDVDVARLYQAVWPLIAFAKKYQDYDEPHDIEAGQALRDWDSMRGSIGASKGEGDEGRSK